MRWKREAFVLVGALSTGMVAVAWLSTAALPGCAKVTCEELHDPACWTCPDPNEPRCQDAAALEAAASDVGSGDSANSDALEASRDAASDSSLLIDADAADGANDVDASPPCDDAAAPSVTACVVTDVLGVFVEPASSGGSDSAGDGTMAKPLATIGAAMAHAATAHKRVYACVGSYNEQLSVGAADDGLAVYGGLDCAHGWTYAGGIDAGVSGLSVVAPSAAGVALTLTGLSAGVSFEDFGFVAQDAPAGTAGASSVAVFANSARGVTLHRCNVVAGAGAAGADGAMIAPYSAAAPNGTSGTVANGGAAQPNPTCLTSIGGAGGDPGTNGNDGEAGAPGPANGGTVIACQNNTAGGSPGANGTGGGPGAGATMSGTLSASGGWSSTPGQAGGAGAVGQGGGGGASVDTLGGGGGGGGAGGCGGAGGAPGGGGGSSIAVLALGSAVDLEACTLVTGRAGSGGSGGAGQVAQIGGTRGLPFANGNACSGGRGGVGGSGGGGGGGAGGLSAGVLWSGTAPTLDGTTTPSVPTRSNVTLGAGGAGGQAGAGAMAAATGANAGQSGTAGTAGSAAAVLTLP